MVFFRYFEGIFEIARQRAVGNAEVRTNLFEKIPTLFGIFLQSDNFGLFYGIYEIFAEINLHMSRIFTADGNGGEIENRLALEEPFAQKWRLVDKSGGRWAIEYYDIQSTNHRYQIDGEDINGNIISVLLRIK